MKRTKTWEISDEFWAEVEPLIPTKEECRDEKGEYKRKSGGGRKRKYDDRTYFSAIVYVLRTGIIWNALPREKFGGLGSSALHRRFQLWERGGLFTRIWEAGLNKFDELEGIDWEWQSADGCQIKAPLATESAGANRHDSVMLEPLLADRFVPSEPPSEFRANLCLDAGYAPHIRSRGEEKQELENNPDFHARRWVVEAFHSWLKRFRKLCPRYEKPTVPSSHSFTSRQE